MRAQRLDYLGGALAVVYVGSVVLANWLTTHYGLAPVGFGLYATAGTFAIGGAILTRDLVQDTLGRWLVLVLIAVAAALSFVVSSHQIAEASGLTFLIGESLEWAVYTPLRQRVGFGSGRWGGVVVVANVVGALADTFLFLWLAGFPVVGRTVGGQMVGKLYVTAAVVLIAMVGRAVSREPLRA